MLENLSATNMAVASPGNSPENGRKALLVIAS
jgi:hypothetical protein